MASTSEQSLSGTSQLFDIREIVERSHTVATSNDHLNTYFNKFVKDVTTSIQKNLKNEWNSAVTANPTLSTPKILRRKKLLLAKITDALRIFREECKLRIQAITNNLWSMNREYKSYISNLDDYYRTIENYYKRKTNQNKFNQYSHQTYKDYSLVDLTGSILLHNSKVWHLQLLLNKLKQGIVIVIKPKKGQKRKKSFQQALDAYRNLCIIPGETAEEKVERDRKFYSWKAMLKLPSNWLLENPTSQPTIPEYEGIVSENIPTNEPSPIDIGESYASTSADPGKFQSESSIEGTSPQQNIDISQSFNVKEIWKQENPSRSCEYLKTNFIKLVSDIITSIETNLKDEWNSAVAVNPALLTPQTEKQKERLANALNDMFFILKLECEVDLSLIVQHIYEINRANKTFMSLTSRFNEANRNRPELITPEYSGNLWRLRIFIQVLKENTLQSIKDYKKEIKDLEVTLNDFKERVIRQSDPLSDSGKIESFQEILDDYRNLCIIPGETAEEKVERDKKFYSWEAMLKLPSRWLLESPTSQPTTSQHADIVSENIEAVSSVDQSNIPSTSGVSTTVQPSTSGVSTTVQPSTSTMKFNVPSSKILVTPSSSHAPSPTQVSSSPQTAFALHSLPRAIIPLPTFAEQSDDSISLEPDKNRPRRSIGDTPHHHEHIETSQTLSVCEILRESDLNESCVSLKENFEKNILKVINQIHLNIEDEWNHAGSVNPSLKAPNNAEFRNNREILKGQLREALDSFKKYCLEKSLLVIGLLPQISELRQNYISKLMSYYETLREFTMNKSNETRARLIQLEIEKDSLRIEHNESLINYNSKVLHLQLQLDNLKYGIITDKDLSTGEEKFYSFQQILDSIRNFSIFPHETTEEKLARNRQFYSWTEMLGLPQNWWVEVETPQLEIPENELTNAPSTSNDQANVSPFSSASNVPFSGIEQISTPSPPRSDEMDIEPPSVQQPVFLLTPTQTYTPFPVQSVSPTDPTISSPFPVQSVSPTDPPISSPFPVQSVSPTDPPISSPFPVQSVSPTHPPISSPFPEQSVSPTHPPVPSSFPTSIARSDRSSSLESYQFRPTYSNGATSLHRQHDENKQLILHVKRSYEKIRRTAEFFSRSDPFSNSFQEIRNLIATVDNLSTEWRTMQANVQRDGPTERNRQQNEPREGERMQRRNTERITIQSLEQLRYEWIEARHNLRTYFERINADWDKILKLEHSLTSLNQQIEEYPDDESLIAAEITIHNDLEELRTKSRLAYQEINRLKNVVITKRDALIQKIDKFRQNLINRQRRLQRNITHSQINQE